MEVKTFGREEVKEWRDQGVPWITYVNTKITKNQNREGYGEHKNKWGVKLFRECETERSPAGLSQEQTPVSSASCL